MTAIKRKRVYRQAGIAPAAGGHAVHLDERPIKTPGGAGLVLPNAALAHAVAEEWNRQDDTIEPETMPLMSLTCTATDLIAPRRAAVIDELADYGETDLICYRVERPPELVARQDAVWQPLVHWADESFGAELEVTYDVLPKPQSAPALAALRGAVEAHDDLALSALATAIKASGSLVIGLALARERLDAEAAFDAAELHETYQIEVWGEDAEATRRRAGVRADLAAAHRLLSLLRG